MPRKQLDILKDLCRAHRDRDEGRYQEVAQEFVRYLKWKKFRLKAQEFEEIFKEPTPGPSQEAKNLTPGPSPKERGDSLPFGEGRGGVKTREDNIPEPTPDPSREGNVGISGEAQPKQGSLFGDDGEVQRSSKAVSRAQAAWQVSQGAEINFVKTQRLLEELLQHPKERYTGKDFAEILGYAKKKANGFARLLYYLGLLEEKPRQPTPLARLIHQYDPYFEDIGTLWFLHYWISSQPHLVIWNRIVNQLFPSTSSGHRTHAEFTLEDAKLLFEDQRATHAENSFKTHLRKEFNVCTRAYLESEFNHLHLLTSEDGESFVRLSPAPAPDDILLAAILLYRSRFYPNSVALEVTPLVYPENAPGRLFFLHEVHFREALERLRLAGSITIESFADLDQIKFVRSTDYLEGLEMYYQEKFEK